MNNVEVFQDTQYRIQTNLLLWQTTKETINNTRVYEELFTSEKQPYYRDMKVSFEENLTLLSAAAYCNSGKKTAVLNFANPIEPGGGVLRGANAQEEYLCRASNLYYSLTCEQAKMFYQHHKQIRLKEKENNSFFLASDLIIYSPGVTVIREDIGYLPDMFNPTQEYTEHWMKVDVITCAAPYFANPESILSDEVLYTLFRKRIRNIFESAIDNDVDSLVLGAFGCGAFHNPPMLVAKAFSDVLLEKRYRNAFSDVLFAVKRSASFCENIEAFEIAFQKFPPTGEYVFSTERNKRRFLE